jgi:hypothetical protein
MCTNKKETDLKQPKSIGKFTPAYGFKKNLKKKIREPKVSRLLPNLCDFHTKILTLGYG